MVEDSPATGAQMSRRDHNLYVRHEAHTLVLTCSQQLMQRVNLAARNPGEFTNRRRVVHNDTRQH